MNTPIRLPEKIAYGLGDMASTLVFATVTTFLMYFYTDVFGISAAAVGTLFFVARMIDAISDPLMGALADRTSTRWGKFRPFVLFGALPLALLAVATFTTPELSQQGKLTYAYITYISLMVLYTVVNIPYSSMPTLMSSSSKERTQLTSFRMFFGFFAMLIVSGATLPLVEALGNGSEQQGFQSVMMLFAAIATLLFTLTFFFTKERIISTQIPNSLISDFKVVSKNRAWWVLLAVGISLFSFTMLPFAVGMYFFSYNIGDTNMATGFFVSGNIGMLVGVVITGVMAKKLCKKRMMIVAQFIASFLSLSIYWLDMSNIYYLYVLFFTLMIAQGVSVPIMWSMVSDAADFCEWKQNRRVIALTTSSVTFSHKFGMGISGVITGTILSYFGYTAGGVQSENTLHGILVMMSLLPAFGYFINGCILCSFPINKQVSEKMQSALEQSRAELACQ